MDGDGIPVPTAVSPKEYPAMKRVALVLVLLLCGLRVSSAEGDLAKGFAQPPVSAKPQTWWHWVNGNISREGITADLEEMKRVGLGGAQMFNVSPAPPGPVRFMSPEWRAMVKHAVSEADRLGLELCIHNCAGWSSSGGPWIKPEGAMQMLVWSEQRVTGPGHTAKSLPRPLTRVGFHKDIAVVAFPTPKSEASRIWDLAPRVSASEGAYLDAATISDGDVSTFAPIPTTGPDGRGSIDLRLDRPFTARSITLIAGPRRCTGGELQVSDDGTNFRTACRFGPLSSESWLNPEWFTVQGFDQVTSRFFRVLLNAPDDGSRQATVAELDLSGGYRTGELAAKIGAVRHDVSPTSGVDLPAGDAIARGSVVDLTDRMSPDGRLDWDAPAGDWTVLRIGYTPVGKTNHPAPEEGTGLECDKLSAAAVDAHFEGMMAKVISDIGPLAGKTLKHVLIDSYETGPQNWTPSFREEFKRRRGYDLFAWFPTITGRVVDAPEASERFLWDFRRTISDMWAENYYGHFADLAHKNGMLLSAETYGNGIFDDLACSKYSDIPMSEFWSGSGGDGGIGKEASSAAHTYGRPYVGAESFTSGDDGWQYDPYSEKALGDLIWCSGVNRFIFHTYAHQPWFDRSPGMTMGSNGLHFNRMQTWWRQGAAWVAYITRCQYLLQRGQFVADLLYYAGENPISGLPGRPGLRPSPPPGYDYDGCGTDTLLTDASVHDGRIVLKSGMSYRLLVLPDTDTMTSGVLRRIRDLVKAGATVVGPKPARSPSLSDSGAGDAEIRQTADDVWGACDGKAVTGHSCGRGRVYWGKDIRDILTAMKAGPDFEFTGKGSRLASIHRRDGSAEIYFVSNQRDRRDTVECSFRVTGKLPELWHPDTGRMERMARFAQRGGRTIVPLSFDPAGSVFVVFREPSVGVAPVADIRRMDAPSGARSSARLFVLKAVYGILDDPAKSVDVTAQVAAQVEDNTLSVEASNYLAGDPASMVVKSMRVDYSIDGVRHSKTVREGQFLDLPDDKSVGYPDFELTLDRDRRPVLTAWKPGAYELTTASGRRTRIQARSVPDPITVPGPWEVRFDQKWGAPASTTFDRLTSWTEHGNPAIRYYSGTAEYVKGIDLPSSILGRDRVLSLDLGGLANLAEVSLNGRNLGILWKPPFRVDITGLVHAGKNSLRVRVTNLWVNRLIGDSALPQEKRLTWTTFNPYNPQSPLMPSGLLGPVMVRAGERVVIGNQ